MATAKELLAEAEYHAGCDDPDLAAHAIIKLWQTKQYDTEAKQLANAISGVKGFPKLDLDKVKR
ncbi:hypothetical protein [Nitrospira sp. BLG_2]|uniref:hypothetical protein n=1 Tax=Nitrospira sp. BLG_2 TaxID=3397507 RepID=UPI003B9D5DAC